MFDGDVTHDTFSEQKFRERVGTAPPLREVSAGSSRDRDAFQREADHTRGRLRTALGSQTDESKRR
jgi:hypothetical protein